MKVLIQYLQKQWKLFLVSLALASINQVFSLLDPLIFRHIIDQYAVRFNEYSAQDFIRGAGLLVAASIGAAFISRVAKNLQDYCVNTITQKLGAQIYTDGIRHALQLPYALFEDQQSGETLGKLQRVRADVEKFLASTVNVLFTNLVGFIFVIIYSITVHWLIVPMYLITCPLIAWVSTRLSKKIKILQVSIVAETTALAGSTTESLRNIELVKSLGLEDQEILRLNGTTSRILALELRKVRYIRSLSFLQGTVVNLLRSIILFTMLCLIYWQQISFGQFLSLYLYSFFIFGPLQELGNVISLYHETEVSLSNFVALLNQPLETTPISPVLVNNINELNFHKVCFQHNSATSPAIQDISFRATTGETIAFVGPSGAGKSTLAKLLVGLYHANSGEILVNNTPIVDIDLNELRSQISFVTQDTQLFSGTIRENLLFVSPNTSDDECINVLNRSACQSILQRAPKGLDTIIGEGGVKLSGGERQRLSIARALLRQPSLIIFDEATSSLDSITESEINRTIHTISKSDSQIIILIAHRLSTVMNADKIFVLEQGQIIESGRHNELLALKGLYFAMWRQQIGERQSNKDVETQSRN